MLIQSPIQSPGPPPLLSFKQVACRRDSRTLFAGIDYAINTGDIVQITGPNGIGKTTLLRAIMGLMPDYDGEIHWQGQLIDNARYDFTRELLFIGHLTGVKKSLTPRENLQFLANLQGSANLSEIDDALEQVGLYGYEDMLGDQLSAGQYRRVALARLYLSQTLVWVLDEPYTALDIEAVASLEALFVAHAKQGGCVIFTSHQAPSIAELKVLSLTDFQSQPFQSQPFQSQPLWNEGDYEK
jgi:heme exporter protein A